MIRSLFKITEHAFSLLSSKEARKYRDRTIKLRKQYYEEENKDEDNRNHALMDNIQHELCILADTDTLTKE